MSKHSPFRLALLPVAAMAVAFLATGTMGAEPGPEAARLDSFTHADGANYFALSLTPGDDVPATAASDVVVMFDTSATQTGQYRADALAALKAMLGGLAGGDRVHLVAVDMNAIPMTSTFVAPDSPEMTTALEKLEARVPLGATDMEAAIRAAVGSFAEGATNARSVVYLGDGMSKANMVTPQKLEQWTNSLVQNRVAVSSYGIGAAVNRQLLGALAGRTGGVVVDDDPQAKPEAIGGNLAAAARGTVLWPESVTWPAGFSEIFPKSTPPLRTDRDSVVIGTYQGAGPFAIQMTAQGVGGPKSMAWSVVPNPPNQAHSHLVALVEAARLDTGTTLPIVGSSSLLEAAGEMAIGGFNMAQLARQALNSGDLDNADRLAQQVLRRDPQNREARAVADEVAQRRAGGPGAAPAGPADLNLVGPGPRAPGGAGPFDAAGAFVDEVERQRKLVAQMITADVQNTLNQARGKMSTEPVGAIQDLKVQLEGVRRAPELNPEVRDQLIDQIQAALRHARQRQVEDDERKRLQYEGLAAAKERMLINENLLRKQQKLEQLMERFNSLMAEGRYRFAEEAAALEAQTLAPESPVPIAATLYARTKRYYVEAMALRVARQKGVVDTLYEVERAHVPFPDEPPVVYPDAEIWQQLTARRKERYSSMDLASRGTAEKRIANALKDPTTLEFIEAPLQDVIDYLKELHDIEIQIDQGALEDVGIGSDTPITRNLKGISLRSALRLMLRDLDLTYVIQDEVLLITTPEEAETQLATKVYPVADLVLPIQTPAFQGGFGGLNGMGGGGGMQGGGMGGGMGGQGGMGGGFGGGGGGMGMFNVPQNLLPNVPAGGFRAFSVNDDLSLSADGQPRAPAQQAGLEATSTTEKIQVEFEEGADPQVVWDRYFATHDDVAPAALRDAVRRLMKAQKFDHVIALIRAALRHNQPQSWMYEAMALAMQAADYPAEEIERAVMSAVDLADSPLELMYTGVYLDRIGLGRRALKVYQQVAQLVPLEYEPYMQGLRVAQRLDDMEGIKWATVGILSQAWPNDKLEVWKTGLYAAADAVKRLRAEKRFKEAREFMAALDKAVIRDCVVKVSWTGDADVDLAVEEPSGTVCSFRNPRTTGGGVMLGDTFSQLGRNSAEGLSEIYVCPKGFRGDYKMLLRRVWGKLPTGKVLVTIYTNYRTKDEKVLRKYVSLGKDETLVKFNLDDGRRTESLREHQVANAAVGHLAVRRQILGQQLAAGVDPRSMLNLVRSRQGAGNNGSPFFPVAQGAVGYQPVIITLPEGTNLSATAVVSADRRYVRVSCVPLFSGVSEVNVFNTQSGANTAGRGGTGGQGYSGLFGNQGGGGGGVGGGGGGAF